MESMCYTYILKCSDGTYYTGWTNDLDKRLKAHNGGKSGAKYTKKQNLVFRWVLIYALLLAVVIFGMCGPGYDPSAFIYEKC